MDAQTFWLSWPCLPLPAAGAQDASAAVVPITTSAPVLGPLARQPEAFQSCPECGGPVIQNDRPGGRRKVFCSRACAIKTYNRRRDERCKDGDARDEPAAIPVPDTLADIDMLPDVSEKALYAWGSGEDDWTRDQLKLPALPWEKRE